MKQNEFLEIIEQNKGKHRLPIETLILGRRIGGIVGGEEPPKNILEDGKYKFAVASSRTNFAAFDVKGGMVYVYAQNNEEGDNINRYSAVGNYLPIAVSANIYNKISEQCSEFDNFISIQRRVVAAENLTDFENYKEL